MALKTTAYEEVPFDMEKVKSDIKLKYGINYDDTTLVVMDILQKHAKKLSGNQELKMDRFQGEMEFVKNYISALKKEQEARLRTQANAMGVGALMIIIMVTATFIFFWRRAGEVDESIDRLGYSISNQLTPAIGANQAVLDSILHKKSNDVRYR